MSSERAQSLSAEWRQKGNAYYTSAENESSSKGQAAKMREAINSYGRSLSTAASDNERSSAGKNMALANWKMAKAQMACGSTKQNITFYFKEALKYFKEAKEHGKGRDMLWCDGLMAFSDSCWSDVHERIDGWGIDEQAREIQELAPLAMENLTTAREFLGMANLYFNQSVTCLATREYQLSLRCIAESNFPLQEALRFGKLCDDVTSMCEQLEQDLFIQHCVAQSIQARIKGEELLQAVIHDEEILNIDMVWEVVDWFCAAAMLTRDRDLELEAMALSCLGKVYHQVLKMKDRAKKCLMKTMELADALTPRNFSGEEWYVFACSILEKYQQEVKQAEEQEDQKKREEMQQKIKEELAVMTKNFAEKGKIGFLEFIYATYPPKNPTQKLEVPEKPADIKLKKLYQKALFHYHPDKANLKDHGAKWKALTSEITKFLTQHYERMKGIEE